MYKIKSALLEDIANSEEEKENLVLTVLFELFEIISNGFRTAKSLNPEVQLEINY